MPDEPSPSADPQSPAAYAWPDLLIAESGSYHSGPADEEWAEWSGLR